MDIDLRPGESVRYRLSGRPLGLSRDRRRCFVLYQHEGQPKQIDLGVQTFNRDYYRLQGRRVVLEPLVGLHVAALYEVTERDQMADRWPRSGRQRTLEEFERFIWQSGRLKYAMLRRDSGRLIGVVQGMNENDRSRTIGVGIIIDPDLWLHGWPFEGLVLFVNILFEVKGFRKVYFHMSQATATLVGGAMKRWLTREATFKMHTRLEDSYEDWHTYSLFQGMWDRNMVDLVAGRPASHAGNRS
jgi:RimJ/RimL family protein N-acetyltransferase